MKKATAIAIVVAFAMVSVAIFVAFEMRTWGSETGTFPYRVFKIGKAALGSSDGPTYVTSIEPWVDCNWWVELTTLGGSAVEVTVDEIHDEIQVTVSKSEVTQVGQCSEKVVLDHHLDYLVTLRYIGNSGTSTLGEHVTAVIPAESPFDEPISISSDAEFTEENGVVSGSGTESDPYVISGLEIYSTTTHCIQISGTEAHFVIRDCFLHGDLEGEDTYYEGICNIKISYCTNAVIENVTAIKNDIGLNLESCSQVRVSESNFSGNSYGVYSRDTSKLNISWVTSCECKDVGIYVGESDDFTIENCSLESNKLQGIIVYSSSNGVISDNVVANSGETGIMLLSCGTDLEMYRNIMDSDGVHLLNCDPDCYDSLTIDESNTVNGLPVMYFKHQHGLLIENVDAGQILVAICEDLTIRGLTLADCDVGIAVAYSSSCFIMDCIFTDNDHYGVYAIGSDLVNVSFCQASNNVAAVLASECTDVHFFMDEFTGSTLDAIGIYDSSEGTIMSCQLMDSHIGLEIEQSTGFTAAFNQFVDNYGIGVNLEGGSNCLIYHNDFVGSVTLAQDTGYNNHWDNGYPSGGNYWSDYDGEDLDMDGIGDTPYVFNIDVQDSYPLMAPSW